MSIPTNLSMVKPKPEYSSWFSLAVIWRPRGPRWEDEVLVNMFRMFPRRWANHDEASLHIRKNMWQHFLWRDVYSNKSTHNKTVHVVKHMQLGAGTLVMQWSEMHMNQTLELWHSLNLLVSLLFHSSLIFRLRLVQFASFYFVSLQNLYG